jgi:phosphoribosylglycinamide formyltransferase-1
VSVRIAVFASGGGTNLQALLDRFDRDDIARIVLVVSDRPDAGALERAERAGIRTAIIAVRDRDADDVAASMLRLLSDHDVQLIALAGYLRLVPPAVVNRFRNRILNIHPALLPSFGGRGMYGLRVHAAVLNAGCTVSGATVHRVDERYDEGGIIAQWPVPVKHDDTPETLAARVLRVEHILYPAVIAETARRLAHAAPMPAAMPGDAFTLGPTDEHAIERAVAALAHG